MAVHVNSGSSHHSAGRSHNRTTRAYRPPMAVLNGDFRLMGEVNYSDINPLNFKTGEQFDTYNNSKMVEPLGNAYIGLAAAFSSGWNPSFTQKNSAIYTVAGGIYGGTQLGASVEAKAEFPYTCKTDNLAGAFAISARADVNTDALKLANKDGILPYKSDISAKAGYELLTSAGNCSIAIDVGARAGWISTGSCNIHEGKSVVMNSVYATPDIEVDATWTPQGNDGTWITLGGRANLQQGEVYLRIQPPAIAGSSKR